MDKKQTSQIPNILLSIKDASVAISVSTKTVRSLIASGRLKAVNLGQRMTRISLQELTAFAELQGCQVQVSSSLPFNNKGEEGSACAYMRSRNWQSQQDRQVPQDTSQRESPRWCDP